MNIEEVDRVLAESDLLVSESDVVAAIARIAAEMTAELKESNPVLICCMNGGLVFAGQLADETGISAAGRLCACHPLWS